MKKLNRTYVMGLSGILFSAFLFYQIEKIPERLVSNEPGPKLFPYIAAGGILICSVLSMIFDGRAEGKREMKQFLDKNGWKKLAVLLSEIILFGFAMHFIGFWITSMAGMFVFILTLKGDKKINYIFAVLLSIFLGSLCYWGFTKGFMIPLPKGALWSGLGIKMF